MSVSDHGTPPLTAARQARVSILVFTPLQSPFILIDNKATTMTIRFDLKNTASSNIAQYGVIVQEYSEDESNCELSDRGATALSCLAFVSFLNFPLSPVKKTYVKMKTCKTMDE